MTQMMDLFGINSPCIIHMTTSDDIRMALVICGYECLQHAQLGRTFHVLTAPLFQRDFWETTDMLRVKKLLPSTIMSIWPQQTVALKIDESCLLAWIILKLNATSFIDILVCQPHVSNALQPGLKWLTSEILSPNCPWRNKSCLIRLLKQR